MRKSSIRRGIVVVLAIGSGVVMPASALAQSLSITAVTVSDFSSVTLSGSVASATATMSDFSVTDTRGTGEGWNVVVQGTVFAEWDGAGYVAGGKTLPVGSLSMPAPSVSSSEATPSPPTMTAGPYAIDGYAVKIASAAAGAGEGTYTFTQTGPLTLTVVAAAYARTYRGEITVSVASGP